MHVCSVYSFITLPLEWKHSKPVPIPIHGRRELEPRFVAVDLGSRFEELRWVRHFRTFSGHCNLPIALGALVSAIFRLLQPLLREKTDGVIKKLAWYDPRLNLQKFGINETLTLRGDLIMPDIWKPDLFFANVKKASVPQVTVPNQLVKIAPDGRVSYSMRYRSRIRASIVAK
ncbi:gamma-aminobutyric acid receptor subunit delta-like [Ornithodoros turicata]|uniref:gamma-aminobutyric acid receptor subunit delta-like n=1 Tax=Ornithodoros turicata TaxID=34597 RepID=UPI00313A32CE